MVGAGQLARMTHQAAVALGQSLRVLAVREDDPAALVTPQVVLGHHTDLDALRTLADGADVVTFDHEHTPTEHLRALVAAGVTVRPCPDALRHAQDKLVMRTRLQDLGVAVPRFAPVTTPADVAVFGAEHGWPVVLKSARGGYDGRGVWFVGRPAAVPHVNGSQLLVEQRVPLRRELAAVVARSPFGQAAAWPVVQTVQADGICVEVLAPAPGLPDDLAAAAQQLALRIAAELDVVGVLAVELFETPQGALLVNELAMRPHNSAHWTIEGSLTSQFEQHLRAVLDYPLGVTDPTAPAVAMANVLGATRQPRMPVNERLHHLFARLPEAKVHLYGKAEWPGRKVGHVTVLGERMDEVIAHARLAAGFLATGRWPDGQEVSHG